MLQGCSPHGQGGAHPRDNNNNDLSLCVDADLFENTLLGFREKVILVLEKPISAEFPYPSVPPYTFGDSSASSAGAR